MFEAMRAAALLHKVSSLRSARAAGPRRRWSWRRGAAPKRSAWPSGSAASRQGKQADIITVSVDDARQTPLFDPISHLVYVARGDDVRTTIVAGRVLMRDGQVHRCARRTCFATRAPWPSMVRRAVGGGGTALRRKRGSSVAMEITDRAAATREARSGTGRGDPPRLRRRDSRSTSSPC